MNSALIRVKNGALLFQLMTSSKILKPIFCSFTDQPFKSGTGGKENSAILITNPMDAKFVYGHDIENTLETMRNSTHIRVLGNGNCIHYSSINHH